MRASTMFGLPLLSLALPFAAFAEPHVNHGRSHHDLAKRAAGDVSLNKRGQFNNARWTFYDVGEGACGKVNVASDFIVALNSDQYGGGYPGPQCFKQITMTYNGKTTTATIMDECPGCPYGGLDLSRGLFTFFAPESEGVLQGTWSFVGSGGDEPSTTTKKATPTSTWTPPTSTWTPPTTTWKPETTSTPKTTSTKTTPTSTWTPPTTTSSSTSSKPSTTSKASTSSSASKSSSSSASSSSVDYTSGALAIPTGSVTEGSLRDFNQAVIGIGGLIVAGGQL